MSDKSRLWGARFRTKPDASLLKLSRSPESYFRLYKEDLAGSKAHANELKRSGLLTDSECNQIISCIGEIEVDIEQGIIYPDPKDEDLHAFLERQLIERLGSLGGKIRAGRSRNDQTSNDMRLYLRAESRKILTDLLNLQEALVAQANLHINTIAPGFTHLQPAQPIIFGHHLMAHAQAFIRDCERMRDWDQRCALSPLGAAALSGSAIAVHPELAATELGYDGVCENSIDAVASRDHVAEFLFVITMLSVNLSRLSEEIIIWNSRQFRWVILDDAFATGSSIMPQKKNPDIPEITRGAAGLSIGGLTGMLAAMKALPLAYNRDLWLDKRVVFDCVDSLSLVLPAMAGLVRTMTINTEVVESQASDGFTLATEMADWLSRKGIPFNEAHEITGHAVRLCEDKGIDLAEMSSDELKSIDERLTIDVLHVLTPRAAVEARLGYGGTAPVRVQEQIQRMHDKILYFKRWITV